LVAVRVVSREERREERKFPSLPLGRRDEILITKNKAKKHNEKHKGRKDDRRKRIRTNTTINRIGKKASKKS
jgi:hypothetical protein